MASIGTAMNFLSVAVTARDEDGTAFLEDPAAPAGRQA
jgi:hypothetical protein